MARKVRVERLPSRNFEVIILNNSTHNGGVKQWLVRNRETCAETVPSTNFNDYTEIKKVWRKSKDDFESACRFMNYGDLFSTEGVKL